MNIKKLYCAMCALLLISAVFSCNANAKYSPKLTAYTAAMNQCLSCTKTVYPPIHYKIYGNFVTVDGRKIWVEKYGKGSPAVILINGGGETIRQWNKNIPAIEKFTTVIAYDRQGLGRSELIDRKPRTAKAIVDWLEIILKKINVKPPYVLVGHSIGGLYLSYFARRYPKQVAGIVTIDGNNKFQVMLNELNTKGMSQKEIARLKKIMLHPTHLIEVTKQAAQFLKQKKLTPKQKATLIEDLEVMGKPASAKEIQQAGKLPNVPLVALTEGNDSIWHSIVKQFADEVPCSVFKVVPNSSHHIMIDRPIVVNNAIKTVVMAAREHRSLCDRKIDAAPLFS